MVGSALTGAGRSWWAPDQGAHRGQVGGRLYTAGSPPLNSRAAIAAHHEDWQLRAGHHIHVAHLVLHNGRQL